ncbi:hypothetical protein BH10ACT7_BH10ACT7_04120 [soil metagenome]
MDLSHPGVEIIGEAEANVLRSLSRLAEPASGRQLALLSGAETHSTVNRYLKKLRQIGLVHATDTPSAILYRLNRDHVFWPPLETIIGAREAIDDEIAQLVQTELGESARVAAFGSVANRSSTLDSDYDLLLIVDDRVSAEDRVRVADKIASLVERRAGNPAQVIDVSESELRDLNAHESSLVGAWRESAQPLDGRGRLTQLGAAS